MILLTGACALLAGVAASPGAVDGFITAVTVPAARAVSAPGAGLPASRVSTTRVQRQPRPGSCHALGRGLFSLPDPRCTPGAIDPAVTQSDLRSTICRSGYSESVRPPESVTEPEKRASLVAYGEHLSLHDYEYDHLVSLELGGARNDPRNLWPEPGATPNPKDALEDRLHERVCDGKLSLATAQLAIARDWVTVYHRYLARADVAVRDQRQGDYAHRPSCAIPVRQLFGGAELPDRDRQHHQPERGDHCGFQ